MGDTLNGSIDNLLALLDNWAHAIQFRDGIGHVFRGEATLSPRRKTPGCSRFSASPRPPSAPRRSFTLEASLGVLGELVAAGLRPRRPRRASAAPVPVSAPGLRGGATSGLEAVA